MPTGACPVVDCLGSNCGGGTCVANKLTCDDQPCIGKCAGAKCNCDCTGLSCPAICSGLKCMGMTSCDVGCTGICAGGTFVGPECTCGAIGTCTGTATEPGPGEVIVSIFATEE
jgi:hypothetical protein